MEYLWIFLHKQVSVGKSSYISFSYIFLYYIRWFLFFAKTYSFLYYSHWLFYFDLMLWYFTLCQKEVGYWHCSYIIYNVLTTSDQLLVQFLKIFICCKKSSYINIRYIRRFYFWKIFYIQPWF
jgi:hypothetical protein